MAPRGRGKFSKPSRGGGKHFSRDVQPIDKDGNPVGLWRDPEENNLSFSEEDESSESGSEESSDNDDNEPSHSARPGPSSIPVASSSGTTEMTREERRAAAKAKKQAAQARRMHTAAQPGDLPPSNSDGSGNDTEDDDDDLPANPNHTAKSRSQLSDNQEDAQKPKGDLSQLSRREREAIEAHQARQRYLKLHAEGKTEEARSDLARLAIVREQREADRLRKEAEKEERVELAKQRAAERDAKLQAAKGGKKKGVSKRK